MVRCVVKLFLTLFGKEFFSGLFLVYLVISQPNEKFSNCRYDTGVNFLDKDLLTFVEMGVHRAHLRNHGMLPF